MTDGWDGTRKIIWAKHLDEMEIIGTNVFSVGVPVEEDPEFKASVFAAGVTIRWGIVRSTVNCVAAVRTGYGASFPSAFNRTVKSC